jgi:hypothetical protein
MEETRSLAESDSADLLDATDKSGESADSVLEIRFPSQASVQKLDLAA